MKISHITKTDKATQTLINKYQVSVVTFQTDTDVREVLQIKMYVTASYEERRTITPSLLVSTLAAHLVAIHLISVVSPQSASSAIDRMQLGNAKTHWHTSKMRQLRQSPPGQFYRLSFISETTQVLTSTATAFPNPTAPAFHFKQAQFPALKPPISPPRPHKKWAQTASQTYNPNRSSVSQLSA